MKPIEEYGNLSEVKSVMFKEDGDHEKGFKMILSMLSSMASLEEIHWHNSDGNDEAMEALTGACPHLFKTLKVFSLPMADQFSPEVTLIDFALGLYLKMIVKLIVYSNYDNDADDDV